MHPLCPGLTTKSQIIVRYLDSECNVEKVRLVSGHELMMLAGWPRERLAEILKYTHSQTTAFAGAAFNGLASPFGRFFFVRITAKDDGRRGSAGYLAAPLTS